ncbi:hypothetical protein [Commensalibacter papalotli (ex Servin-Garciduenas et al. 2014)]|uniref:Helix-turn-helix domain-containing protein n=2 Tax=Commensalibacter TaxID=1079922 RepID=W7DT98_9PROT|nr:hypothetical protein [Commensalibacter papalotli (ex Servin-Garciduenas et al. 2014)]EUK17488.1 hypothetical protein COMX_10128 [Commensalibacter papalotli (ex Servin-Garciduenas et al. 2014)]
MTASEYISISEASRRANISRTALRKHIKVGRIVSDNNGKIEVASFNSWLASKSHAPQSTGLLLTDTIPFDPSLPVFPTLQDAEL